MTNENELFNEIDPDTVVTNQSEGYKLEDFLGEDKKYKSPEDVAKAIVEKDNFIKRLETENAQMREELKKSTTLEEFMTKMEERRGVQEASNLENQGEREDLENSSVSGIDVEKLVEERFNKMSSEQKKAANLSRVLEKAKEVWGADANLEINKKAKELGVSVKDLQAQAETNPNVFFRLVGLDASVTQKEHLVSNSGMNSSVDTSKMNINHGSGPIKNKAYYDRIRVEDRNKWFSSEIQNEMHQQALKLGEKFFE